MRNFDEQPWGISASDVNVKYTTLDDLPDNTVSLVAVGSDGTVWVGTYEGLGRLRDGAWSVFTTADDLPNNTVSSVAVGADGTVWAGTDGGLGWRPGG